MGRSHDFTESQVAVSFGIRIRWMTSFFLLPGSRKNAYPWAYSKKRKMGGGGASTPMGSRCSSFVHWPESTEEVQPMGGLIVLLAAMIFAGGFRKRELERLKKKYESGTTDGEAQ